MHFLQIKFCYFFFCTVQFKRSPTGEIDCVLEVSRMDCTVGSKDCGSGGMD